VFATDPIVASTKVDAQNCQNLNDSISSTKAKKKNNECTKRFQIRGCIFSCVRPFYERVVSDQGSRDLCIDLSRSLTARS